MCVCVREERSQLDIDFFISSRWSSLRSHRMQQHIYVPACRHCLIPLLFLSRNPGRASVVLPVVEADDADTRMMHAVDISRPRRVWTIELLHRRPHTAPPSTHNQLITLLSHAAAEYRARHHHNVDNTHTSRADVTVTQRRAHCGVPTFGGNGESGTSLRLASTAVDSGGRSSCSMCRT